MGRKEINMTAKINEPVLLEKGDWRAFVHRNPGSWNVEVWLIHRNGNKQYNATVDNGNIKMTEIQEGTRVEEPFLRVLEPVWQLLVDAMTESTPPTKKERIEAELDATKKHLDDMRKIAFDSLDKL